jgi:hypothetical protein
MKRKKWMVFYKEFFNIQCFSQGLTQSQALT